MKNIANKIIEDINDFFNKYNKLDESTTSKKIDNSKWSLKEIISHLIDSASNNHQRIIRLQLKNNLDFPDYKKDEWLSVSKPEHLSYKTLLNMFYYYNQLLSHLIANISEDSLNNCWNIEWDGSNSITLEDLIKHYLEHLEIHIKHFEERLNELLN